MDEKKEKQELREAPVYRLDSQGNLPGEAQPPEPLPEFDWDEAAESSAEQEAASQEDPSGFQCWLELAVKGLYYPPDRRKVSQELRDHFTDRVEDYRAKGHPMQEAYRLAVKSLGDPTETAALLRTVHKPWLGWLLCSVRLLVIILLVIGIFNFSCVRGFFEQRVSLHRALDRYENPEALTAEAEEAAWRQGSCGREARLGSFTISMDSALICRTCSEANLYRDDKGEALRTDACLVLRFGALPWYTPDETGLLQSVKLTDGLGRVYQAVAEDEILDTGLSAPGGENGPGQPEGSFRLRYLGRTLGAAYYLLLLEQDFEDPDGSQTESLTVRFRTGVGEAELLIRFEPWQKSASAGDR